MPPYITYSFFLLVLIASIHLDVAIAGNICNQNNCLRALLRANAVQVSGFCDSAHSTLPVTARAIAAICGTSKAKATSACSCFSLLRHSTSSSKVESTSTTGTPSKISSSSSRTSKSSSSSPSSTTRPSSLRSFSSSTPKSSSSSRSLTGILTSTSSSASTTSSTSSQSSQTTSSPFSTQSSQTIGSITSSVPTSTTTYPALPIPFQPALYAPPVACPNPLPATNPTLLQYPDDFSAFAIDPGLNFSIVGDPTFQTLPQIVTTLGDAGETVVYNFSLFSNGIYGFTATVANESSFTFWSNGDFEFFPGGCVAAWIDTIANFNPGLRRREPSDYMALTNVRRAPSAPSSFAVTLFVVDQCGNPVPTLSPQLSCQVQISNGISFKIPFYNTIQTPFADNNDGSYSGQCDTANTEILSKLCTDSLTAVCGTTTLYAFPGFCATVGKRIGGTIGGGLGSILGVVLGPGDFVGTFVGVFLGGQAGQYMCDAAFTALTKRICPAIALGNALGVVGNVCDALADDENVLVQADNLPGGIIVVFPTVSTPTAGVTATQTVSLDAVSCTRSSSVTSTSTTPSSTITPTVTPTPTPPSSCAGGQSPAAICSGQSVDLCVDNNNCGFCGNICPGAETCSNGVCCYVPGNLMGCPDPFLRYGSCANIENDSANCGGCGNICSADELCVEFGCVPNCPIPPVGYSCNYNQVYVLFTGQVASFTDDYYRCQICSSLFKTEYPCLFGVICPVALAFAMEGIATQDPASTGEVEQAILAACSGNPGQGYLPVDPWATWCCWYGNGNNPPLKCFN